jgi:leucyl-tRNA synthetase
MKGDEPMTQLRNQGIVLGEDSEKMSKSRGNVIAPDELLDKYGADVVRAYLMFFARWDQGGPWNSQGIEGTVRWLKRVWTAFSNPPKDAPEPDPESVKALRRKVHQILKQVTTDYESFEFNTIVAALMELMNEMYKAREAGVQGTAAWEEAENLYLRMMAPITPHIAEELWERSGRRYSVHTQPWPEYDEDAAQEEEITLVVQVNGKLRDRITVPVGISDEAAKEKALASSTVQKFMGGKEPRKVIVIEGKLVNIVV